MRQIGEPARSLKIVQKAAGANADGVATEAARFADELDSDGETTQRAGLYLPSVRTETDNFLNAMHGLKSLSERVWEAADREIEHGGEIEQNQKTDLATLRLQVKEESLKARGLALRELEEAWRAKLELAQSQLRQRQVQLKLRESELARLAAKIYSVVDQLNQTESDSQKKAEQLEDEIAELKQQLKERDERLSAKLPQEKLDEALREHVRELELRLQASEEKVQRCEAELKEKENLIQAAAAKEAEIGKLIARLSAECEKLSSELRDKGAGELQNHQRRPLSDLAVWKKIVGRIHEQAV